MTGVYLLLPPRRRAAHGPAWTCRTRRHPWPAWAGEVLAPYDDARRVPRRERPTTIHQRTETT